MRIVSQDRLYSVNFDRCELWMQGKQIYAKIGNESRVLGLYKTEESAITVFKVIHEMYQTGEKVFYIPEE